MFVSVQFTACPSEGIWAVKRFSVSMLLHKFYVLATSMLKSNLKSLKLKTASSRVIHVHPSHFCSTVTCSTNPFNVSTSCGWFCVFSESRFMILEWQEQTYINCSSKNYAKEQNTLAIDDPRGPIVYYKEASGSRNGVCHCVAWPTLSRGRLIIWKKP